MHDLGAPPRHQLLLNAGLFAGLGWLLTGLMVWIFIQGVSSANRPHEVTGEWAVFSLAAIDLILAVVVTVLLVRSVRRDGL